MKWADAVMLLCMAGVAVPSVAAEEPDEDELALLEFLGELDTEDQNVMDFFEMMEEDNQTEDRLGKENEHEE